MATSGTAAAQVDDNTDPIPGTPVEVSRDDGTTPGLVREWRVDGFEHAHQERVVVATKRDGEVQEIDVPRTVIEPVDEPEAGIIRDMIPARGEGDE